MKQEINIPSYMINPLYANQVLEKIKDFGERCYQNGIDDLMMEIESTTEKIK